MVDRERIALVEQRLEILEKTHEDIRDELKMLNDSLSRYRGFLGGIVFVVSGMWGLFILFKDEFLKLFK